MSSKIELIAHVVLDVDKLQLHIGEHSIIVTQVEAKLLQAIRLGLNHGQNIYSLAVADIEGKICTAETLPVKISALRRKLGSKTVLYKSQGYVYFCPNRIQY